MEIVETQPGVFVRMKERDADRWRDQHPDGPEEAPSKARRSSRDKARSVEGEGTPTTTAQTPAE